MDRFRKALPVLPGIRFRIIPFYHIADLCYGISPANDVYFSIYDTAGAVSPGRRDGRFVGPAFGGRFKFIHDHRCCSCRAGEGGDEKGLQCPCDGVKAVADNGIGAHCFFFGNGSYIFPKARFGVKLEEILGSGGRGIIDTAIHVYLASISCRTEIPDGRRRVVFQFPVVRRRIIGFH